ncbi:MAG: serine hydrolase [Armatimonadota bacterium]|nr:serine hydrolase [Armatimonadota bacterium]
MKLRVFIDGASRGNPGPAALGVVLEDARGKTIAEIGEYLGETTNNTAEYQALLRALREARARRADDLEIFADSELLVQQIRGRYRVKSPNLAPLHHAAIQALAGFPRWRIAHVQRIRNAAADTLANRAIDERTAAARPAATVTAGARPRSGRTTAGARGRGGTTRAVGGGGIRSARGIAGLRPRLERLARDLDGTLGIGVKTLWDRAEFYVEPDRPFPTASVFKIPVLIELLLQVEEGRLDLDERVAVTEALKSPGSGVLKELSSAPSLSLSDLAMLMIIISDNTATDILVERVGIERINRRLASWGFTVTRVPMDCRRLLFELAGRPDGPFTPEARIEVEQMLRTRERVFTGRAYADHDNNLTTPREMIALLEMLVTEGRLSPWVRDRALSYMRKQQVRDRLPFYLPPGIDIAHKTGSIAGVRNDAGILFVDRGPVLVCAFARDLKVDLDGTTAIAEIGRMVHEAFA